jgi:YggT family protein
MWAVIARSLLSWFPVDQGSQVYQVLFKVTEPIVDPIRRVMPNTGMIDMSPMIAIMGLIAMQYMVAMLVAA